MWSSIGLFMSDTYREGDEGGPTSWSLGKQEASPAFHQPTKAPAVLLSCLHSCCPSAQNAQPHPHVRQSPGISPSSSGSLPTSSRPFPCTLSHKLPLRESLVPLTYTYHCIMGSLSTELLSILLGASDGQASTPSNLYTPVAGSI